MITDTGYNWQAKQNKTNKQTNKQKDNLRVAARKSDALARICRCFLTEVWHLENTGGGGVQSRNFPPPSTPMNTHVFGCEVVPLHMLQTQVAVLAFKIEIDLSD